MLHDLWRALLFIAQVAVFAAGALVVVYMVAVVVGYGVYLLARWVTP